MNTLKDKFFERWRLMRGGTLPANAETEYERVEELRRLKRERNIVALAHYYMPAELQIHAEYGGIADFVGDSLGLSQAAARAEAEAIIFCGVAFMAETAKILNPTKTVLLPSREAGCSLAESISGADVRALKSRYPGVLVMAYINTYAETKAECDVCCTSRNALSIARAMPGDRLLFVPDKFMGANLRRTVREETGKELLLWDGACEVHEQFTRNVITMYSVEYPDAEVLVHWEVPDEVVGAALAEQAGMVGSTTDIIAYVAKSHAKRFIVGSECDLGATLRGMFPDKEFLTPCVYCPYMKHISLANTLDSAHSLGTSAQGDFEVTLQPDILNRARAPIQRMLELS